MHFKMVALTRCKKTGAYIARKGIPADVRDAHEKLYGARWEAKFYARGSGPLHESSAASPSGRRAYPAVSRPFGAPHVAKAAHSPTARRTRSLANGTPGL
jgi:hypothetical protein